MNIILNPHNNAPLSKILHYMKYARIRVFTNPYSPDSVLYGRIRVSENPYSRIFYPMLHFSSLNTLRKSVFQIKNKYYPHFQIIGECEYGCED